MSENWETYKIEDIASKISIGPFGSRMKSDCYVDEGIPVLRGKNLGERPDFISDFVYITEKKADELLGCNVFKGDLVFPHRGAIGEVGLVTKDERFVLSSSLMKLTCDNTKADSRFVYYFFKSDIGKRRLLLNESQVGTPGIGQPLSSLRDIDISLPPLPEQRAIASILSAIDDKIELNLQMNKTLEEMAITLYKHWFVDFGPFQDGEFVDSELGMIPKGWEVKLLQELGKMFYGQMPKKELIVGEGYPIYSGYRNVGYYQNYNCDKGKVIVVARGVGGTGDIKLTSEKCFLTNLSICFGNDIGLIEDSLLFFGLKRYGLDHLRTGSAQPQITINDLNRVEILVPPKDIQSQFRQTFSSLLDEIESHTIENQILSTLRDTLLPKLISGEVRVKEAEKALADVL